jgi:hypothetical protein
MATILASSWIWILLAGTILYLYFGRRHSGHMGSMGGCGGGHSSHQSEPERHDDQVDPGDPHGQHPDHDPIPDDRSAPATPAPRHGGC